MKNFDLISVIAGLFVVMLVFNLATGRFVLGFDTPGIIAHSEHLWNILGMYTVGFAAVLAGGCLWELQCAITSDLRQVELHLILRRKK